MKTYLAGASALVLAGALSSAACAQTVFVQAGRLLADPATGKVETAKTLVLENGKVARIVDGYVAEPGGTVVDLKDSFVLPGLIDSHVHLTGEQADALHDVFITCGEEWAAHVVDAAWTEANEGE